MALPVNQDQRVAGYDDWHSHHLWKKFFSDPSKWWDNRNSKSSPRQPDFIHRVNGKALWTDSRRNPLWVQDELGKLSPMATHAEGAILPSLIWACCKNKDLLRGTKLHDDIKRRGLPERNYSDALISMYAKCGDLQTARRLLDMYSSRSFIPWNALLEGYLRQGRYQEVFDCFDRMQCGHVAPSALTYGCILKACAVTRAIDRGQQIHDEISKQGLLEHNAILGGALVDMYAKCGALLQAQDALAKLPFRNIISWSSLIAGYAQKGQGQQALQCLEQMQGEGIAPNAVTYASILKACASIGDIDKGKQIHDEILRQGLLEHHVVLGGALVDMYAKCGALSKAQEVLENLPSRNEISWSALIAGYAQNAQGQQALCCFEKMRAEGITPNASIYACILKACASIGDINKGKQIHDEISRHGLLEHTITVGNALVDMYAKCGALPKAQDVFRNLPSRDVISWNALIAGYARNGQGQQAMQCFEQMQTKGIHPDEVTYACILKACALTGAIMKGKQIHDEIMRLGFLKHHVVLGGALVDMYAKCGNLSQAQGVLEKLPSRDVVSWSALIAGYAKVGQFEQAFRCYERMQNEGILPDSVTFLCLLNVCSQMGLVKKGQELFDRMQAIHSLEPSIECYNCMIDLFGRAGHFGKAMDLIRDMPFAGTVSTWHGLLGACCKWVNVSVGSWAFKQIMGLDKSDAAAYVLMANIYIAAGMREKANDLEALRIKNNAWKLPGCHVWTDLDMEAHELNVDDINDIIVLKLQEISSKMFREGYCPVFNLVSQGMSHAWKVHELCFHSEKLALAFALLKTPVGCSIFIRKNMQMCVDCHTAMSFISKTQKRKIIVTDANLSHCFENGKCSCDVAAPDDGDKV